MVQFSFDSNPDPIGLKNQLCNPEFNLLNRIKVDGLPGMPKIIIVLHYQPAFWRSPKAFESLSAISELTPLLPFKIRFSVEGETPSFEESCLPVIPNGSR